MAIYKSSFNKKPEKKEKEKKPAKEQEYKIKTSKQKKKINVPLVCLIVFSVIFLVCILPSNFIKNFLLGVFGLLVYPVCVLAIVMSAFLMKKRSLVVKTKYMVYLSISLFIVWFIFHLILTSRLPMDSYGTFLAETYRAKTTAGGLIFSLLSYPAVKLLTTVGAYIFSAIALAIFVGLIIDYIMLDKNQAKKEKKSRFDFSNIEDFDLTVEKPAISKEEQAKKIAKQKLGLEKGESTIISSSMPNLNLNNRQVESRPISKREYILTPLEPVIPPENTDDLFLDNSTGYYNSKKLNKPQENNFDSALNSKGGNAINQNQSNVFASTNNVVAKNTNVSGENVNLSNSNATDKLYTANQSKYEPINANAHDAVSSDAGSALEGETTQSTQTQIENAYEISSNKKLDSIDSASYREEIKPDKLFADSADNKSIMQELDEKDEDDNLFEDLDTDDYSDIILDNSKNYDETKEYKELNNSQAEEKTDKLDYSNLENMNENFVGKTQSVEEVKTDLTNAEYKDEYSLKQETNLGSTVESEVVRPSVDISRFHLPSIKKPIEKPEQVKMEIEKPKQEIPPYVAPPVNLLNYIENPSKISDEELQDNIDRLEQVLADFKVPAKVNNVQVGPAVTRYELTMPRGISVNKIAQMADDIAMTLASNGSIRVEAPIPGKNSVGIEVPNNQISSVSLRELVDSNEFRVRGNPLSFVLGKDINGNIIFCNLDKMPHLLVAGSTGSGKSVCLNSMLLSMCYKAGPQDLRLILIDPKMVEFSTYNGLPHLLIPEVITNKEMTINALDWAIKEMERRYALFAKNHVVNINEFNKSEQVRSKKVDKLPFIVIVVDELADLMLEAKREIEDRIAKLAAKARAAGIHLVLATQRPSVDVITGTVKANLPSRIAFALTNYMDSKTVLDGGGAEKLLGKGDMLFKPQDKPEPRRVQGAFVSSTEISKVVEYIKQNNKPVYDDDTSKAIKNPYQEKEHSADAVPVRDQEFDPVLKEALRMFIQTKQASGSMISRRYSVGFNRAGRIMDQMERAGFIGPQEGSKPRQVLITMDEYNAIFGEDEN